MNQSPPSYEQFIDAFCGLTDADPPSMRHTRFDLTVAGTNFSLLPSSNLEGIVDGVAYFGEVGMLPEHGRAEAAVQLLEQNLYSVGADIPAYCCHPEKPGMVLIAGRMPLRITSPERAMHALNVLAQNAAEMRESFAKPAGRSVVPSSYTSAAARLRG